MIKHHPTKSEGLTPFTISSVPVSTKPLSSTSQDKFDICRAHLKKNLESIDAKSYFFGFRDGPGFVISPEITIEKMEENKRLFLQSQAEHLQGIEVVNFDPLSGNAITVGRGMLPELFPLLVWGFNTRPWANYSLLLTYPATDKGPNTHQDNSVDKLAHCISMEKLVRCRFPSELMLKTFSRKQESRNDEGSELDRLRFNEGELLLSVALESLTDLKIRGDKSSP